LYLIAYIEHTRIDTFRYYDKEMLRHSVSSYNLDVDVAARLGRLHLESS
jgi:hypothetical protein